MLLSLHVGGHGELEPKSLFVCLDGLGQQRCNRIGALGSSCQEGFTGQVVSPLVLLA